MNLERIVKNEKRLDKIYLSLKNLDNALKEFKLNKKDLNLLNRYYGSNAWFKDKEDFEKNENLKIKAGVLSEDAVWNMNEDIDELVLEMQSLVKSYLKTD